MTPPWDWPRRLMGSVSWGPIRRRARAFDFSARARIVIRESRPGSRCLRQQWRGWRKVRAPADRVPGNAWGARAHGKCNREQTAQVPHGTGKGETDRKSTRLNSSHLVISYAVFCLKKKKTRQVWCQALDLLCLE